MKLFEESEKTELKKSTAQLREAVISIAAILNKYGHGEIYFGIKNDGTVVGQDVADRTLRKVTQTISGNIEPTIFPKVEKQTIQSKNCIKVTFQGDDKPYFAYGRVFIRVGEEDRRISTRELERLFIQKNQYPSLWEQETSLHTIESINKIVFHGFLKNAKRVNRLNPQTDGIKPVLEKLNLLNAGKLTRAAELLFCNENSLEIQL